MPRAETEQSLKDRDEIATFVCERWKFDGFTFLDPKLYRLDGVFTKRGQLRLFFEAKQRREGFRSYPDFIISLGKLIAARSLMAETGLRSMVLARFADGVVASFDLLGAPHSLRIGGRTDRPDFAHDIEPVAVYQWDEAVILLDPRPQDGGAS
jgi:hypothetical protein